MSRLAFRRRTSGTHSRQPDSPRRRRRARDSHLVITRTWVEEPSLTSACSGRKALDRACPQPSNVTVPDSRSAAEGPEGLARPRSGSAPKGARGRLRRGTVRPRSERPRGHGEPRRALAARPRTPRTREPRGHHGSDDDARRGRGGRPPQGPRGGRTRGLGFPRHSPLRESGGGRGPGSEDALGVEEVGPMRPLGPVRISRAESPERHRADVRRSTAATERE